MSCKHSNPKSASSKTFSLVSVLLGAALVATSIAYIVWHRYSERIYNEKWKDYDDCGLA